MWASLQLRGSLENNRICHMSRAPSTYESYLKQEDFGNAIPTLILLTRSDGSITVMCVFVKGKARNPTHVYIVHF